MKDVSLKAGNTSLRFMNEDLAGIYTWELSKYVDIKELVLEIPSHQRSQH